MRLQHYNAATRGGTGNRGTADVQAPYERKRRRNPWLGLDGLFRSGSHLLVFAGSEIGPLLGVENLVLCLQNARGSPMRPAHLSLIDLRARMPSTSSGSSWSACARDSSNWSRPLASLPASATASSSSRRSTFSSWPNICLPPSPNGHVAQHSSRSAQRKASPPAVPCAHRPQAARESRPSRPMPRRRDSGTRRHPRSDVVANPRGSPATVDGSHPVPGGSRRPRRIPCRTPPPLRPETRPGAPWTRRVARRQAACKGRDAFSGSSPHALRARTTRKTAVGRLLFPCPTSLPPLQARPRCMRLAHRKARHRDGPQSLRSKT